MESRSPTSLGERRCAVKKKEEHQLQYRVFNPLGQPAAKETPVGDGIRAQVEGRARRLRGIEGRTIYLVDVGFGGGYEFLEEMQKWFSRHRPTVRTVLKRKKGNMFLDDPDLWAEIKARSDAVILGVGG